MVILRRPLSFFCNGFQTGQSGLKVSSHDAVSADEHCHHLQHEYILAVQRPRDARGIAARLKSEDIDVARRKWLGPVGLQANLAWR